MNGLNQVKTAIVERLRQAGLQAVDGFGTQKAAAYSEAVVAVEVTKATGSSAGLGDYLGTVDLPESGKSGERYGWRLETSISLDVYALGGGAACETAMEQAGEVLMGGLPAGLRLGELSWGETTWNKAEQRYVRRGTLACTACFTATVEQETGLLLDFILKGVVQGAQHNT